MGIGITLYKFFIKSEFKSSINDLEEMARRFVNSETNPVSIVFSKEFAKKYEKLCF